MSQFPSLREYELLVYTLPQQFLGIRFSTLVFARRGRYLAELKGELAFTNEHQLAVDKRLTWETGALTIEVIATRSGAATRNCTGTTPNRIPMIRH